MFPAMIIVPMMQICWTLFAIVCGMLYFQEYKNFDVLKAVMFVLGVMVRQRCEEEGRGEGRALLVVQMWNA